MPLSDVQSQILMQIRADGEGIADRVAQEMARVRTEFAATSAEAASGNITMREYSQEFRSVTGYLQALEGVLSSANTAQREMNATTVEAVTATNELNEALGRMEQAQRTAAATRVQESNRASSASQVGINEEISGQRELQAALGAMVEADRNASVQRIQNANQTHSQQLIGSNQEISGHKEMQASLQALAEADKRASIERLQEANRRHAQIMANHVREMQANAESRTSFDTLVTPVRAGGAAAADASGKWREFSFLMLSAGHATQDFTSADGDLRRGFQSTINNIPMLSMGIARLAGASANAAMSIAGIGTAVVSLGMFVFNLMGGLEGIKSYFEETRPLTGWGDSLKGLQKELQDVEKQMKEIGKNKDVTAGTQDRFNALVARQVELEKKITEEQEKQKAIKLLMMEKTEEQVEYEQFIRSEVPSLIEHRGELVAAARVPGEVGILTAQRDTEIKEKRERETKFASQFGETTQKEMLAKMEAEITTMRKAYDARIQVALVEQTTAAEALVSKALGFVKDMKPGEQAEAIRRLIASKKLTPELQGWLEQMTPEAFKAQQEKEIVAEEKEEVGLGPMGFGARTETRAKALAKRFQQDMARKMKAVVAADVAGKKTEEEVVKEFDKFADEWIAAEGLKPGLATAVAGQITPELDRKVKDEFARAQTAAGRKGERQETVARRKARTEREARITHFVGEGVTAFGKPIEGDELSLAEAVRRRIARNQKPEQIQRQMAPQIAKRIGEMGIVPEDMINEVANKVVEKMIEKESFQAIAMGPHPVEGAAVNEFVDQGKDLRHQMGRRRQLGNQMRQFNREAEAGYFEEQFGANPMQAQFAAKKFEEAKMKNFNDLAAIQFAVLQTQDEITRTQMEFQMRLMGLATGHNRVQMLQQGMRNQMPNMLGVGDGF